MPDNKRSENFDQPMHGSWPDPKNIICKDCAFRDKTVVKLNDKTIPVGVTKSFCKIYEAPPKTNGKPLDILFQNADCKYYRKEEPDD